MTAIFFRDRTHNMLASIVVGIACLCATAQSSAQGTGSVVDNRPPVIELEELAEATANSSQVFTVQIAEESELRDATLYHRRSGQEPYAAVSLEPLGSSGFYTVSINTDPADLRAIEYYVQARDASGNRTVSGFAFDPYTRSLAPARFTPAPVAETIATTPPTVQITQPTPFYKKRWFQITLGVVAVGALASSLDSGGDETRVVPVTLTLE